MQCATRRAFLCTLYTETLALTIDLEGKELGLGHSDLEVLSEPKFRTEFPWASMEKKAQIQKKEGLIRTPPYLQFPNAVALNTVGCKNTQRSANASSQKSAKGRKRALLHKDCKQPGLKQTGFGTLNPNRYGPSSSVSNLVRCNEHSVISCRV